VSSPAAETISRSLDVEQFLQESGLLDGSRQILDVQPLTAGYSNHVYRVDLQKQHEHEVLIAKIYSGLAKCRQQPDLRGLVDHMAEKATIGPRVHHSTPDGIITEFLPGTLLNSSVFMSDTTLRKDIAERLAHLHALETPPNLDWCCDDPLIWCACDALTSRTNRDLMLPGFDLDELIEHVELYRNVVASTSPKVVTGHGDLKPTNIIQLPENRGLSNSHIQFIDFELAGPGYRGYDIFKLFRAAKVDEDKLRQFVIDYLQADSHTQLRSSDQFECEVEKLYAEALMFEPLTYLEPVIFFNSAVSEFPDQADKFTELARARWDMYLKTKHHIKERADALHKLEKVCHSHNLHRHGPARHNSRVLRVKRPLTFPTT
jgi:thiamine kinase-like enzyme